MKLVEKALSAVVGTILLLAALVFLSDEASLNGIQNVRMNITSDVKTAATVSNFPTLDIYSGNDGKKVAVIHIGPHKTGTTSVQNTLAALAGLGVLQRDNFHYLGKSNMETGDLFPLENDTVRPLLWKGPLSWFRSDRPPCIKAMDEFAERFREEHASMRHDVIASAEEFSSVVHLGDRELYSSLQKMIPTDRYDVHFVMMYRRYFEWLLSLYHFNFSPTKWYEAEKWNIWPCSPKRFLASKKCGNNVSSFEEFYNNSKHPRPSKWNRNPRPFTFPSLYQQFNKASPPAWKLHVVNMHDPASSGNVVVDVLCGMNATGHACGHLQSATGTNVLVNQTRTNTDRQSREGDPFLLDYELMAQHAFFLGSVNENITRRDAVAAFRDKFQRWRHAKERNNATVPLRCLTGGVLSEIYSESVRAESTVVPAFFRGGGNETLRAAFQKLVDSKKLCNVHFASMFSEDPEWKGFLSCLKAAGTTDKCLS